MTKCIQEAFALAAHFSRRVEEQEQVEHPGNEVFVQYIKGLAPGHEDLHGSYVSICSSFC